MFKNKTIIVIVIALLAAALFIKFRTGPSSDASVSKEVKPSIGMISITFATTGVVEPQNRLEIKPPINGRVEDILVREGDKVTQGQVLALMSSTDRAALLDSARAQGKEAVEYWDEVYKATPLLSPIDGEVIVRAVEPGQTVTSQDAVIVLSDRLIVKAQFDETDIGRVALKQKARISLDAYPDTTIEGFIGHVAYESKLVNNVTIYEVDIIPKEIPPFFRSGMSATVEVVEQEKTGIMLIPAEAVVEEKGTQFVFRKEAGSRTVKKAEVTTGLSDGTRVEVISGIAPNDTIVIKQEKFVLPKKKSGRNPFMPDRSRARSRSSSR